MASNKEIIRKIVIVNGKRKVIYIEPNSDIVLTALDADNNIINNNIKIKIAPRRVKGNIKRGGCFAGGYRKTLGKGGLQKFDISTHALVTPKLDPSATEFGTTIEESKKERKNKVNA